MVKDASGGKRRRTRERLEAATLVVIDEQGFAAASLDEIAARAGVTKGAVYSNYRTKGELLWEAARRRSLHMTPLLRGDATLPDLAAELTRSFMALLPQARREADFHAALEAYVRTDPTLQARQAVEQAALFDGWAGDLAATFGDRLTLPARDVVLLVQSVAWGLLRQAALTPAEVTEERVGRVFEALVGAVGRPDSA